MLTRPFATLFSSAPQNVRRWLLHLGGIGLIPLGVLDSSLVPVPGSMDVATILLSARERHLWFYYAIMATAGSVLGAFITYRLARKGGQEALTKRFPKRKVDKVLKTFEPWCFATIAVTAIMPPTFKMLPCVIAAVAMPCSLL